MAFFFEPPLLKAPPFPRRPSVRVLSPVAINDRDSYVKISQFSRIAQAIYTERAAKPGSKAMQNHIRDATEISPSRRVGYIFHNNVSD